MYTLVIIDMQKRFFKHYMDDPDVKRVIKRTKAYIDKAKRDKAAIIYLEFDGFGKTIHCLQTSYKKQITVCKSQRDGSLEIYYATIQMGYPPIFRLCGIFADQCVEETVQGLKSLYLHDSITVLKDAVFGTEIFGNHYEGHLEKTLDKFQCNQKSFDELLLV